MWYAYTLSGSVSKNDYVSNNTATFTMGDGPVNVSCTHNKLTYTISINASAGGTLSASKTSGQIGDTITVTVTPQTGYSLTYINVVRTDTNNLVKVLNSQDLSFTMPASNVRLFPGWVQMYEFYDLTCSEEGSPEYLVLTAADDVDVKFYTSQMQQISYDDAINPGGEIYFYYGSGSSETLLFKVSKSSSGSTVTLSGTWWNQIGASYKVTRLRTTSNTPSLQTITVDGKLFAASQGAGYWNSPIGWDIDPIWRYKVLQ